jgi:preprotein translocase subunit SecG
MSEKKTNKIVKITVVLVLLFAATWIAYSYAKVKETTQLTPKEYQLKHNQ